MLTIVSGTNRAGSNTRKIALRVQQHLKEAGATTHLLDLAQMPLEALSPEAYATKPASFNDQFIQPVLEARGLIVVTPEYNGGFPGALKLFIDLLPFPDAFESRPAAFVGLSAGASGAVRPVEQLQMVFAYRNAVLFNRRVFLPKVSSLLNDQGNLTDSAIDQRLKDQASGFLAFTEALATANLLPGTVSAAP